MSNGQEQKEYFSSELFHAEEDCDLHRPLLTRTLSSHHWQAAAIKMVQKKSKKEWAGAHYGHMENSTKWEYVLTRNKTRDKIVYAISSADGFEKVEEMKLPTTKRCKGHVIEKESETGKHPNRKPHRCKNKVVGGGYCHVHQ